MISWIQHHLIRHGRWIFLTLLAIIIIAFVFTIGNTPGCTTDRTNYQPDLFYGIDLNSPLEREPIIEKASLSGFLNGQSRLRGGEIETRIAMLSLADEIGVPAPDQAAIAEYIKTKAAFQGPDGNFSIDAYTRFLDGLETNPGSKGRFQTVLVEDYRIEEVSDALSGPGYILPSEAAAQAQRSRTKLALATAGLPYADFEPDIADDEEALKAYYETNKQRYEVPERAEASYVMFKADDYVGTLPEASDAELREHFAANRARFVAEYEAANPKPIEEPVADGTESTDGEAPAEEAAEPEVVTFEKVRESVAKSYAMEQAMVAANEAAHAFAYKLHLDQIKLDSAAFNQLLNKLGVSLTEIEPYTRAGARQRALSPALLQSAFELTGTRYFSDAYEVNGGFAVLISQGRITPEIPPYEQVAAEVATDYKTEEKRRLFNEKGEEIKAQLETKVAEGTAFTEAAEGLGLEVQSYENFEVSEAPAGLNRSIIQQAQSLKQGDISPMLNLAGIGTFVYVESKEVPELGEEDPDLAQTKGMLTNWASFTTRSDLTNELVMRGLPEEADEPGE